MLCADAIHYTYYIATLYTDAMYRCYIAMLFKLCSLLAHLVCFNRAAGRVASKHIGG